MSAKHTRASTLLLELTTEVTCPSCQKAFSLEEGFAVQSLEQYARAAQTRAAAQERETLERLRASLAVEQEDRERRAAEEVDRLKALMAQQSKSFEQLLADQRRLDGETAERRLQQLQEQLAAR